MNSQEISVVVELRENRKCVYVATKQSDKRTDLIL